MKIKQFAFSHFETNCYLLINEDTKECVLVDPATNTPAEENILSDYISSNQLTPKHLLLTHAHPDHTAGLRFCCEKYQIPVTLNPLGLRIMEEFGTFAEAMGFRTITPSTLPQKHVQEGEVIDFGGGLKVVDLSGHCAGSLGFISMDHKFVITGDSLFRQSIGRTDLPTGDFDLLARNIREKLLVLEDDFAVLPGHGDCSTIGDERNNPFLF